MLSKSHISTLLGGLFFLAILLTGCAKDELIEPVGEDVFKNFQVSDVKGDDIFKSDMDEDDGDITDDEDDEDDQERSSDR